MDNYFDKMIKNLSDLDTDLSNMMAKKESEKEAEGSGGTAPAPSMNKSIERLTEFHSSVGEAKEASEKDSIEAFLDKRLNEIFGE